jgi:hypothetical protein
MTMPKGTVAWERIQSGVCPICGEKSTGQITLVIDARFGEVCVCSKHIVHGASKLIGGVDTVTSKPEGNSD